MTTFVHKTIISAHMLKKYYLMKCKRRRRRRKNHRKYQKINTFFLPVLEEVYNIHFAKNVRKSQQQNCKNSSFIFMSCRLTFVCCCFLCSACLCLGIIYLRNVHSLSVIPSILFIYSFFSLFSGV